MKKFWLSWWHVEKMGQFELHSPWWFTGYRGDGAASVVAAVFAESTDAAMQTIREAYDRKDVQPAFRFCEEMSKSWTPFNGRFPRAEWMQWPA